MLKDSEDFIRRRKLTSFTTTPPQTPPTQQACNLNMMMASALNMSATPSTTQPAILNVPQTTALALTAATPLNASGTTMPNPAHLPAHMAAAAAAAAAAIEQLSQQQQQQQMQQHHHHQQQQQHMHQQQPLPMPINIPQPAAHHHHHLPTTANTSSSPPSTALAASNLMPATSASLVQDHYSLRWNNHQNHILRAFDALLQTKTLVDVTLVSADTSIRAHKMVLSACSPFFQRVFADTPCKHPVIVLKDFPGWVVQALVDFMYRGEISVQQERLQSLIQAGESLQVRGLVESSVPEHTPTPAASPDDFAMAMDTSLSLSSELERCSSFDDESPSMVTTSGSKVMLPSRLFGSSASRRERKREREIERDMDSDHELNSDLCTSPMPRRKQARPRRRSSDMPLELPSKTTTPELQPSNDGQVDEQPLSLEKEKSRTPGHIEEQPQIDPAKTIIKREMLDDSMDDHEDERRNAECPPHDRDDSGHGNESREHHETAHEKCINFSNEPRCTNTPHTARDHEPENDADDEPERDDDDEDDADGDADADEHENVRDNEDDELELMNSTLHMRRRKSLNDGALSDGPEDLCTTKKDNDTSGVHSMSDSEGSPSNNNNNNNNCKLNNNNNRIVLSLKDIRQLNKPSSSSTPNSSSGLNPFSASSLRDLRMDRSAAEQQCKMDALEAQMHAAAAAAACAAAANGENPFQHMEHQMDLSLAAAAAAAAVSHQQSRERDHQAMQREQREFHQHQQNAYANSLLGQMAGMPGMPGPFGPGGPVGSGQAPHERLEESMNRLSKDFPPSSPLSLPSHFSGPDGGPPHPPSPLPFPPPHMFGLDSPLGLFPPGIDPGKLYNPLMEMSDPRGMGPDPPPFLKKKMPRPKGQHSAPRGGPPRSWTNAELTEALQHVWNKKMTTSQASRIFGIPYNSLLMYVRGKYGKSLKLEQLRKDCISGPPLELLQMGMSGSSSSKKESNNSAGSSNNNSNNNGSGNATNPSNNTNASNASGNNAESRDSRKSEHHHHQRGGSSSADMDLSIPPPLPGMGSLGGGGGGSSGPRSASSEPDLLGGPNSIFNPFPQGFYPDFASGFPGLPLSMLNLLPPAERHQHAAVAAAMHHLAMDEDCKSVGSKQSSSMDEEFASSCGAAANSLLAGSMQPLALSRDEVRRTSDLLMAGMPSGGPPGVVGVPSAGANGAMGGQD